MRVWYVVRVFVCARISGTFDNVNDNNNKVNIWSVRGLGRVVRENKLWG